LKIPIGTIFGTLVSIEASGKDPQSGDKGTPHGCGIVLFHSGLCYWNLLE